MSPKSMGNAKYFLILLAEQKGYSIVSFTQKKSMGGVVVEIIAELDYAFQKSVQKLCLIWSKSFMRFRTDGGEKFLHRKLKD